MSCLSPPFLNHFKVCFFFGFEVLLQGAKVDSQN